MWKQEAWGRTNGAGQRKSPMIQGAMAAWPPQPPSHGMQPWESKVSRYDKPKAKYITISCFDKPLGRSCWRKAMHEYMHPGSCSASTYDSLSDIITIQGIPCTWTRIASRTIFCFHLMDRCTKSLSCNTFPAPVWQPCNLQRDRSALCSARVKRRHCHIIYFLHRFCSSLAFWGMIILCFVLLVS